MSSNGTSFFLEQGVTQTNEDQDSPPGFEENHQEIDAEHSYRLSIIFGLEQEQKSFFFKMLQSLLPTTEPVHMIGKVQ